MYLQTVLYVAVAVEQLVAVLIVQILAAGAFDEHRIVSEKDVASWTAVRSERRWRLNAAAYPMIIDRASTRRAFASAKSTLAGTLLAGSVSGGGGGVMRRRRASVTSDAAGFGANK